MSTYTRKEIVERLIKEIYHVISFSASCFGLWICFSFYHVTFFCRHDDLCGNPCHVTSCPCLLKICGPSCRDLSKTSCDPCLWSTSSYPLIFSCPWKSPLIFFGPWKSLLTSSWDSCSGGGSFACSRRRETFLYLYFRFCDCRNHCCLCSFFCVSCHAPSDCFRFVFVLARESWGIGLKTTRVW